MFVFTLGECETISNFVTILSTEDRTVKQNVERIYKDLTACNIVFSDSMLSDFVDLGLNPELILKSGTFTKFQPDADFQIANFDPALQQGKINLRMLNYVIQNSDSKQPLVMQVLSLVEMISFK
jgi:hypothetical protein